MLSAQRNQSKPRPAILVVDDDDDVRALISDLLMSEGYLVSEAANGQEALDLLSSGVKPDLMVLDLRMPVRSGRDVLHALLNQPGFEVPVIVVSAEVGPPPLGAIAWLRKPVAPDLLLATIAGAVGKPAAAPP